MKKQKNSKWLKVLIFWIAVSVLGIIIYPLYDLLLCKFITDSKFFYSEYHHLVQPVLFGTFVSLVVYLPLTSKNK